MKRTSDNLLIIGTLTFLINTLLVVNGLSQNSNTRNAYEASYLYIKDYPDRGTPSWGDDYYGSTNGIAHDDANWYMAQTTLADPPLQTWIIWRIPVSEDLDQDFSANPAVRTVRMSDVPALANAGYSHAGDLDRFRYNGTDYLLVPLTGGGLSAIAFFRADNLSFIGYAPLEKQQGAGWCAVTPEGDLITSDNHTEVLLRYTIPWSLIASSRYLGRFSVTYIQTHQLLDVSGAYLFLHHMQGGEFTPSGELLYVSCGILKCAGNGEQWPTDGLHVFDTSKWQEVARSYNSGFRYSCCPPYFIYRFSNDCEGDEPEGLTIWDLDDGRAPNVSGQLHVILVNHDAPFNPFGNDVVSLKHYTRKIYVDASAPPPPPQSEYDPPPLHGTPEEPFNTVSNAFNWYNPIWNGAEIVIKAGAYPETGTFSKRVRLVSQGGVAILGQ